MLRDKDVQVRRAAAWVLGNIGPEAKAAIPDLVGLLQDKKCSLGGCFDPGRNRARFHPGAHDVTPGQNAAIRGAAAVALGTIGPEAKSAIPTLAELLDDKDLRREAASALGNMGPEAKIATPALTGLLQDKLIPINVRFAAAEALVEIGSEVNAAIVVLTDVLKGKNSCLRIDAIRALARTGPAAKTAGPALAGLLNDEDPHVRIAAAEALVEIGSEVNAAIRVLTELLKDNDIGVRIAAAWALGELGPEAKTTILALTELLQIPTTRFVRRQPKPWRRSRVRRSRAETRGGRPRLARRFHSLALAAQALAEGCFDLLFRLELRISA